EHRLADAVDARVLPHAKWSAGRAVSAARRLSGATDPAFASLLARANNAADADAALAAQRAVAQRRHPDGGTAHSPAPRQPRTTFLAPFSPLLAATDPAAGNGHHRVVAEHRPALPVCQKPGDAPRTGV